MLIPKTTKMNDTMLPTKTLLKTGFSFEILSYNVMLIPGIILLIIFSIVPLTGLVIAFPLQGHNFGMQ
jgi:ABC-type polysaccharide transport system permease subunit